MQNNTVPFTVNDWSVDGFSARITVELATGPVRLTIGWDEHNGWVGAGTDAHGQVELHDLAQSLGFERRAELFEALTEDLFVSNFRTAELFVKKVPA